MNPASRRAWTRSPISSSEVPAAGSVSPATPRARHRRLGQLGGGDETPRNVSPYQSGREFDDDLIEQLNVLPELVAAFGFANAKAPGYEADDFLAAAVAAAERAGGAAVVASGDRDSFQLASARTTILYPSRGGEITRIGPEEVRRRYGVDPNQVPDFIALRGDPSDKLPGAAGVGPKRAAQLVQQYGTLDGVLGAGLFPTQAEMLRLFRLIARFCCKLCWWRTSRMIEGERSGGRQYGSG